MTIKNPSQSLPALNNIADVSVAAPADGDMLYWDNATSLWKPKTGGSLAVPLAAEKIVYRMASVSSSPRTQTIQAIAGDVITLTANQSHEWFDQVYMLGNSYVSIWNATRSELAFVKAAPAINTLQVTAAADIATWANGDTVSTQYKLARVTHCSVDLSPILPAGTTAVCLTLRAEDSGAIAGAPAVYIYPTDGSTPSGAAACQVSAIRNWSFALIPLDANLRFDTSQVATGVDTMGCLCVATGYFI